MPGEDRRAGTGTMNKKEENKNEKIKFNGFGDYAVGL